MSARDLVITDRLMSLAEAVGVSDPILAARLRELGRDPSVVRDTLARVTIRHPDLAPAAHKILAAVGNLPEAIGRRGRVWIAAASDGGYFSHWADDDGSLLEDGPTEQALAELLEWAHRRSDEVVVRPDRSETAYYAGSTPVEGMPPLSNYHPHL